MLCNICQEITFKHVEECERRTNISHLDLGEEDEDHVFYFHQPNREHLLRSVSRGCHFCAMLQHHLPIESRTTKVDKPIILRRSWHDEWVWQEGSMALFQTEDIVASYGHFSKHFSVVSENPLEINRAFKALTASEGIEYTELVDESAEASLTIGEDGLQHELNDRFQEFPNPAEESSGAQFGFGSSEIYDGRLFFRVAEPYYSAAKDFSTGSRANLSLASIWLSGCVLGHKRCRIGLEDISALPTRVIDVSNPLKPRLKEMHNQKGNYLTLSYCWGNGRKVLTKMATLAEHMIEIPFLSLPQTFKDAMLVTSALGFKYLWIDALCIVQDSIEDIENEMGNMGQIYHNSRLTIVAAHGRSVDSGLFMRRDPRYYKPCSLNIGVTASGESIREELTVHGSSASPSQPLYDRGWVLQEEILSPRGLIFGRHQISWRCIELDANEEESRGTREGGVGTYGGGGLDGYNNFRLWIHDPSQLSNRARLQRDNQFDNWYMVVTKYHKRALTFQSDKFPALSGLASLMSERHSCTYLAGLWKEDLQVGLAWYVKKGDKDNPNQKSINAIDTYLAPSWSWASVAGDEIAFRKWEDNNRRMREEGLTVIEAKCEQAPGSLNPFGSVTDGFLALKGRLKQAILGAHRTAPYHEKPYRGTDMYLKDYRDAAWLLTAYDPLDGSPIGDVALDFEPERLRSIGGTDSDQIIWCLLCIAREKYGNWQLTCLVLRADDERGAFRRIGLLFLRNPMWMGEPSDTVFIPRGQLRLKQDCVKIVRVI